MRAIDQSLRNKIISLREGGLSYQDIANIVKIDRATVIKYTRHIKLTDEQKHRIHYKNKYNKWSNEEIEFLKINYPVSGLKYCADKINKSRSSITDKAYILKLRPGAGKMIRREKRIIQKLDGNKILCECREHGIVMHRIRKDKAISCSLCDQERIKNFNKTDRGRELKRIRDRKQYQNPKNRFIKNIRNRLNQCYYGLTVRFIDLNYSGEELRDHLLKIKDQQTNKCPGCQRDYDEIGFTIEHIVPVSSGKSKEEIINLFNLNNLSLMCKNCNSSKNDSNFQEWCNSKGINVDP